MAANQWEKLEEKLLNEAAATVDRSEEPADERSLLVRVQLPQKNRDYELAFPQSAPNLDEQLRASLRRLLGELEPGEEVTVDLELRMRREPGDPQERRRQRLFLAQKAVQKQRTTGKGPQRTVVFGPFDPTPDSPTSRTPKTKKSAGRPATQKEAAGFEADERTQGDKSPARPRSAAKKGSRRSMSKSPKKGGKKRSVLRDLCRLYFDGEWETLEALSEEVGSEFDTISESVHTGRVHSTAKQANANHRMIEEVSRGILDVLTAREVDPKDHFEDANIDGRSPVIRTARKK